MQWGYHYTPCDPPTGGGGGALLGFVIAAGLGLMLFMRWLAGVISRAAPTIADIFLTLVLAGLVVAVAAGLLIFAIVRTQRRLPERTPLERLPRVPAYADEAQETVEVIAIERLNGKIPLPPVTPGFPHLIDAGYGKLEEVPR